MTLPDHAPSGRDYNVYAEAAARGLELCFCLQEIPTVAWHPQDDLILIDEAMSPVERRDAVAHAIAHYELEHTDIAYQAVSDINLRLWFEQLVIEEAARNLITRDDLYAEITRSASGKTIAAKLGVPADTLAFRLRTLNIEEIEHIGEPYIDRIHWSGTTLVRPLRCAWLDLSNSIILE